MSHSRHLILLLNFFKEGPSQLMNFEYGGSHYEVTEYKLGNDYQTASALIKRYDGIVDSIALGGIQKRVSAGRVSFIHPAYQRLAKPAARSPLCVADRLRHFFSDWMIQRILKQDENFFKGRKVLFHNASISPLTAQIVRNGGDFRSADALALTRVPRLIQSTSELEIWISLVRNGLKIGQALGLKSPYYISTRSNQDKLGEWIRESDFFFTFSRLLDLMEDLSPLEGKTVFVDYLTPQTAERIQKLSSVRVIEFIPKSLREGDLSSQPLSLLAAVLDIERRKKSAFMSEDEFLLKWIQEKKHEPAEIPQTQHKKRKCAFIVHPLDQRDLWRIPEIRKIADMPAPIRNGIESLATQLPIIKIGTVSGIKSQATGQEAECDVYALCATPKRILAMDEEHLYSKLIQGTESAAKNGAILMGLGAYTKVAGDSGVSVARGSSIPVTNGNSYSAASSIWAAEIMLNRLALPRTQKAMVIGATGSIGRVTALILAEKFKEIVLVATSIDKLLEMKREILEQTPSINVKITTDADSELENTELIFTATSNQSGKLLDIDQVMSGAVICDCSRPFDFSKEEAKQRPDVLIIQSGEILLPGNIRINCDIGLKKPAVYACLAETVLLTLEGKIESYSLSKRLSQPKVKEILAISHKHGASLATINSPLGPITDEQVEICRTLALTKRALSQGIPGLSIKFDLSKAAHKDLDQGQS